MRRALVTLLMAGALAPAIGASAQQSNGGVGIRLLEAPTARQDDPRARRSIVDHVKPGTSFSRKFEVSNTTSGRRLVSIYAAGADVVGGSFAPADGRTQNELSGWITVDTASADLGPGQSVQPRLTVTVPPQAPAGERYAVVWAELPPVKGASGVAVVNRVGLRVYLSVGAGGEPRTDFTIQSLTAERDAQRNPVVKATVKNTGGRALDLSGKLWLTEGPNKLAAGPFDARLGTTLAIGDTEDVTVPLDASLPAGPWHAKIELRSSTTVRTAEATISFPDAAGATSAAVPAHEVTKSGNTVGYVLAGVGLLVVLLLALLVLLLLRRRRSRVVVARPLEEILADLRTASGKQRAALLAEAAAYGKDAIMASPALASLPVQTARDLGERVARAGR
jgi:hypothetical protein